MELQKQENILLKLTFFSIWSLALFSFVSLSATALSHITLALPAFYYTYSFYKKGELKPSKSMIFLGVTVIFAILSVLVAPDISNKAKNILKLKYLAFGLLGVFPYQRLFQDIKKESVRKMLNVFLVLIAIGNIAGIYALYTQYHPLRMKPASDFHRAAGMYGMAITYGYGIEFVLILMLGLGFNFKERLARIVNIKIFIFSLLTCIAGFYLAFARGAMVALILSFPFIFWRTNKKIFKGLLGLGIVGLLAVSMYVLNYDGNGKDTNRFLLKAKTDSNMIRLSQYEAAYKGFLEKPIFGWGYRNFEPNCYDIKKKNNIAFPNFAGHAHNNYLEFLATTGIFGFISFFLFIFYWFKDALSKDDDLSIVVLPFVTSFMISGLFQNTINDGENMFVIMFLYSLFYAFRNKKLNF